MDLPQLLLRHFVRRAAHQILGCAAHGKRNDLPDVLLSPEQHQHSIHTGSHARVGRRAELERLIQGAEFVLQGLLVIAGNGMLCESSEEISHMNGRAVL